MNLLVPYVKIAGHRDPDLTEFTYGDVRARAKALKEKVGQGDYLFFHTTLGRQKLITAYFVVDRTLDSSIAARDRNIMRKYTNPHLGKPHGYVKVAGQEDVVVFGDPILSRSLARPLPFDLKLARRLSLGMKTQKGRTEAQAIASATRAWRKLTAADVRIILREIEKQDAKPVNTGTVLSTDEVTQLLERDLENYIEKNKGIIARSLRLVGRQIDTPVGRMDLLYEDKTGTKHIVELKLGYIGRGALTQLQRYMGWIHQEESKRAKGILVCEGVMPAYEDDIRAAKDVVVLRYGWQMKMSRWP